MDLVADINSLSPVSWPSIIYDVDYNAQTFTIAHPLAHLGSRNRKRQLSLTTIIRKQHQDIRVGIACKIIDTNPQYPLSGGEKTKALILKYQLPVTESNIRSAYRLPLSKHHAIQAKLRHNKLDYYTTKHFIIRDISFAGIALLAPSCIDGKRNPVADLQLNETIMIGMTLIKHGQRIEDGTFPAKAKVSRINADYSKTHLLIGLQITGIGADKESMLTHFIHNAQIDELKRLRAKGN